MTTLLGGDLLQGTAYFQQSLALFQQLDDRQGLASSLATLMGLGGLYQTETMVPATTSFADIKTSLNDLAYAKYLER